MARTDVTIPNKLPSLEVALNLFIEWRDSPSKLLGGYTPMKLFDFTTDIDKTWFVGSQIWYPAVFGAPPDETADIDIVVHNQDAYKTLHERVITILRNAFPGKYTEEPNRYGGIKITRNKTKLIDIWHLNDGQSIAEHILGFPRPHEHCAVMAGASRGDINAITRIVKPATRTSVEAEEKARQIKYSYHYDDGGS